MVTRAMIKYAVRSADRIIPFRRHRPNQPHPPHHPLNGASGPDSLNGTCERRANTKHRVVSSDTPPLERERERESDACPFDVADRAINRRRRRSVSNKICNLPACVSER